MIYKILGIIILVAIAIQFIPYGNEHTNPPVVSEPIWDSPTTEALFSRACLNCHSNETQWPWYSNIAPMSWLVQSDVNEGRDIFNVSMWGVQKKNKGDEAAKEVREGEMPPWYYLIPHSEAKLSDNETKVLIKGLLSTFGKEKGKNVQKENND
ncbi:MAG TPA: cytochrome C [Ignavibacteria bacterium]|nr:cytochrome C [Ignavibacteria bacterium]